MGDLYAADFYDWTRAQSAALRRRDVNDLDYDNLAEEVEALGRRERREIRAHLEVLLIRLLRWKYQPDLRCGRWRGSIAEARHQIELVIEDSPSLASWPAEVIGNAYQHAAARVKRETRMEALPAEVPWTAAEVLKAEWLP